MCDVPSIAVFCSESIECFPSTASKFFLKLLVTIPVAPIITCIIVHHCLTNYPNLNVGAIQPVCLSAMLLLSTRNYKVGVCVASLTYLIQKLWNVFHFFNI